MKLQYFVALVAMYVIGVFTGFAWNVNVQNGTLLRGLDPSSSPCGCKQIQVKVPAIDSVRMPDPLPLTHKERFETEPEMPTDMPTDVMNRSRVHAHLATFSFEDLWPAMQLWTMIGQKKAKFIWDAVEKINTLELEGDILEAGVWKGGATMAMVLANMKHNTDRHFWLLDTFEGLPEPGPKDDARSHKVWQAIQNNTYDFRKERKKIRFVEEGKFNFGPKDVVKNNLYWTAYPWEKFHFIQGKVEETLPKTDLPPKFALVRLDTDWYDSTRIELEYLWDRLVPGGLLYIDDFCSWGGSRTATEEFFKKRLHLDTQLFSNVQPCFYYWKPKISQPPTRNHIKKQKVPAIDSVRMPDPLPLTHKERFETEPEMPTDMPKDVMNRSRVHAHLATFSFEDLWPAMQLWTMIGQKKAKFIWDAVEKINTLELEGDIVEAGVWKGGATMAMVLANMKHNTDRHFWLLDTFEGLPEPGPKDDARSHKVWQAIQNNTYDFRKERKKIRFVEEGKFNFGPKDVVKNNLYWTAYPWEKFHFIQGKVEETLPKTDLPPKFALVRLDTDWYDSTRIELEYLWDRLVPGGLLYIDDFCSWGGSRTATEEFFKKRLHLDTQLFSNVQPCFYYWKPKISQPPTRNHIKKQKVPAIDSVRMPDPLPLTHKERFETEPEMPTDMPTDVMNRSRVHAHLATFSFEDLWPAMQLWTMIGQKKAKFIWDAVEKINTLELEGDILEAGVWKGGATMAMVLANMKHNTDRHFWLLDTFEGLPEPGPKDDARSHKVWQAIQNNTYDFRKERKKIRFVEEGKFNFGPKDVVKNNLYWTAYPWEKFHFIQGKVEETLPKTDLPPKFALVRLDTDWYDSTRIELEYLWDRLVPGGLLYIDDFCSWGGSRTATEEFFKKRLHLDTQLFSNVQPCFYYWKPKISQPPTRNHIKKQKSFQNPASSTQKPPQDHPRFPPNPPMILPRSPRDPPRPKRRKP